MKFSVIVPVYNRPDEVKELLESLTRQDFKDFEVILVEDGSQVKCEEVAADYKDKLNLRYYYKENSGPGDSRNYGVQYAIANFYVFFDSDCIIPETYFTALIDFMTGHDVQYYGGPDKAHDSFTPIQKAINYSMTSFLTTGGIRGGDKKVIKFHPRSFNMGFSKHAYEATGGFGKLRFGEDIDLSLRVEEKGFTPWLVKDAYVYHKRRVDFKKFFKQIYNSGIARINLYKRHPASLKLTHFFPSAFLVFMVVSLLASLLCWVFILPLAFYLTLVFLDCLVSSKSLKVALLSVAATLVQHTAYGSGFIYSFWRRIILDKGEFKAFSKNFYK